MELLDTPRRDLQLSGLAWRDLTRSRVWWYGSSGALLLVGLLLRLMYLDVPLSADVGGYGTAAWWWARGDAHYTNLTITRPQGIFVIFRIIDTLGLEGTRGVHLFATIWTLLTTIVFLAIVSRVWGRGIGLISTALFTLALASPYLQGYTMPTPNSSWPCRSLVASGACSSPRRAASRGDPASSGSRPAAHSARLRSC
jgi:hypothetical protein